MKQPLLCVGKYAETPYYFPKLCVHIRSAEELCYLFKTNPFILDQDIVDKNLADWLAYECGLTELGEKLGGFFRKVGSTSMFVMTILEYVNYCTAAEQEQIAEVLQNNVGLNNFEKKKNRADFLVENGKYLLALKEYELILDMIPDGEILIGSRIYHNRGVAFANLFRFERAAESFLKAFELAGSEESGIQYLCAVRKHLTEGEYIRFIADRPQFHNLSLQVERLLEQATESFLETEESRRLFALKMYKEEGNVNSYYEEINRLAEEIKKQYRENVLD